MAWQVKHDRASAEVTPMLRAGTCLSTWRCGPGWHVVGARTLRQSRPMPSWPCG